VSRLPLTVTLPEMARLPLVPTAPLWDCVTGTPPDMVIAVES
jgi:hypothetical protein